MATSWQDIINNPDAKFDKAAYDAGFIAGIFSYISEEETERIHNNLQKALSNANKRVAIMDIAQFIVGIISSVRK